MFVLGVVNSQEISPGILQGTRRHDLLEKFPETPADKTCKCAREFGWDHVVPVRLFQAAMRCSQESRTYSERPTSSVIALTGQVY